VILCVRILPEGGTPVPKHVGDTEHELCFVVCILLSVFVSQYTEQIRG